MKYAYHISDGRIRRHNTTVARYRWNGSCYMASFYTRQCRADFLRHYCGWDACSSWDNERAELRAISHAINVALS